MTCPCSRFTWRNGSCSSRRGLKSLLRIAYACWLMLDRRWVFRLLLQSLFPWASQTSACTTDCTTRKPLTKTSKRWAVNLESVQWMELIPFKTHCQGTPLVQSLWKFISRGMGLSVKIRWWLSAAKWTLNLRTTSKHGSTKKLQENRNQRNSIKVALTH